MQLAKTTMWETSFTHCASQLLPPYIGLPPHKLVTEKSIPTPKALIVSPNLNQLCLPRGLTVCATNVTYHMSICFAVCRLVCFDAKGEITCNHIHNTIHTPQKLLAAGITL